MSYLAMGRFGVVGLALVAAACGGAADESCDVPTDEISAIAIVVDSGWDLRAAIDFERGDRHGPGTPLRLCDADLLEINGQTPERADKATVIEYSITVQADTSRSFVFELMRTEGDPIVLQADLPEPFSIDLPMVGDPLLTTEDQMIEWSPSVPDGSMQIQLAEELGEGTCLEVSPDQDYKQPGGVPVPDTGAWTILGSELQSMAPEPCTVSYTLARVARGDYPAALESGGRIDARVERYVDVEVDPS